MAEIREKFIPLPALVGIRAKTLSPRQRELINLHRQAKTDQHSVEKVANAITPASLLASGVNAIKAFEAVNDNADASTANALSAAVKYYNDHGRAEQAFHELRRFSDWHWCSPLDWVKAFKHHAAQHGVAFTPGLRRKIKKYESRMRGLGKDVREIMRQGKAKGGGGLN